MYESLRTVFVDTLDSANSWGTLDITSIFINMDSEAPVCDFVMTM